MNAKKRDKKKESRAVPAAAGVYRFRFALVCAGLMAGAAVLGYRIVDLQVMDRAFLQEQGNARVVRTEQIPANRGMILDRRGEPLAVSTNVVTLWADPRELAGVSNLSALASALGVGQEHLRARLAAYADKRFMYLQRHLPPEQAEQVLALAVPGVYGQREYRRYYPAGEVTAHIVGMTNIDDQGQEGLELGFEDWLQGHAGSRQVVKDRRGRVVRGLRMIEEPQPGRELRTSIDLRLQYFAYRELKAAVRQHRASAGSLVLLDARTGEVLALVNQPSFNPNDRSGLVAAAMRNRALTDHFEPGSTVKPFVVAAALESGRYQATSQLDTAPGYIQVSGHTVRDHRDYGTLDLAGVLVKSSNVGVTKLAMDIGAPELRTMLRRLGFGDLSGTAFPGEDVGYLPLRSRWRPIETATLAFGYGMSVTPMQLARAYLALANAGQLHAVTLVPQMQRAPSELVMPAAIAQRVLQMLEGVTGTEGTGTRAAIDGYRVAGKTGTVHKTGRHGYEEDQYVSVFAGIAPVSDPRLVCVVMVDQPRGENYYGGIVAAPVFSRVVGDALRILNVLPDAAGQGQLVHRGTDEGSEPDADARV